MLPKFTKVELESVVQQSTSVRQVLTSLGLIGAGGNYATIHRWCTKWNIDTSHFLGQGHNKGKSRKYGYSGPKKTPLSELLVETPTFHIKSHSLKLRLIDEGIFERKCYKCNLTIWLDQPISLELEHINGIHSDNRLQNLTLLCPNCHSQTPTYRRSKKSIDASDETRTRKP